MQHRSRALLGDIAGASHLVQSFVVGRSEQDLGVDALLRSAVERQLTIIGEAVAQLVKVDPVTAALLPDRHAIVAMRNVLVHAYGRVDQGVIWDVVTRDVPALAGVVQSLLDADGKS